MAGAGTGAAVLLSCRTGLPHGCLFCPNPQPGIANISPGCSVEGSLPKTKRQESKGEARMGTFPVAEPARGCSAPVLGTCLPQGLLVPLASRYPKSGPSLTSQPGELCVWALCFNRKWCWFAREPGWVAFGARVPGRSREEQWQAALLRRVPFWP